MAGIKRVLLIGLDPAIVDYARWPMLTPAKIHAALDQAVAALTAEGYDADICLIEDPERAAEAVRAALTERPTHAVMIGAGVRTDDSHLLLFERLINLIQAAAPSAKVCFNRFPADTVNAVKRWV
ncbi:MAG: hypothetical protein RIB45_11545 [Marivibrio sp.]|uniref:hypothetical protein n=1 Tax=Marivibrio sp. TaxID=2039719 RepID=UPI0032EC0A0E